ncbi:hypothetical protein EJ04DRAFT_158884 [Polyplosphaeria fusca]|uniref:Uncharacterized protein n=1 Tax=Polyplosphaeria fusca TaxID=682080 RepID=A0A9P4QI21_9PLEO|nr:hypothetical protein EJ04DRAFT_158884 [Polyplosphaeria fusca]
MSQRTLPSSCNRSVRVSTPSRTQSTVRRASDSDRGDFPFSTFPVRSRTDPEAYYRRLRPNHTKHDLIARIDWGSTLQKRSLTWQLKKHQKLLEARRDSCKSNCSHPFYRSYGCLSTSGGAPSSTFNYTIHSHNQSLFPNELACLERFTRSTTIMPNEGWPYQFQAPTRFSEDGQFVDSVYLDESIHADPMEMNNNNITEYTYSDDFLVGLPERSGSETGHSNTSNASNRTWTGSSNESSPSSPNTTGSLDTLVPFMLPHQHVGPLSMVQGPFEPVCHAETNNVHSSMSMDLNTNYPSASVPAIQ